MSEPVCPGCGVAGIDHLVSKESRERSKQRQPWFYVVHCDACGHVYGVFPKHTFSQVGTPRFVLPRND
jgi:uncharacterized Zn finger protein